MAVTAGFQTTYQNTALRAYIVAIVSGIVRALSPESVAVMAKSVAAWVGGGAKS